MHKKEKEEDMVNSDERIFTETTEDGEEYDDFFGFQDDFELK